MDGDRGGGGRPEVKLLFQHKNTNCERAICFKVVSCHMDNNHSRLNYIILCRGPYNSVLTDIQKMYQNVKKMH